MVAKVRRTSPVQTADDKNYIIIFEIFVSGRSPLKYVDIKRKCMEIYVLYIHIGIFLYQMWYRFAFDGRFCVK